MFGRLIRHRTVLASAGASIVNASTLFKIFYGPRMRLIKHRFKKTYENKSPHAIEKSEVKEATTPLSLIN